MAEHSHYVHSAWTRFVRCNRTH